jgi:thiamine biosynthesis lipoprotein
LVLFLSFKINFREGYMNLFRKIAYSYAFALITAAALLGSCSNKEEFRMDEGMVWNTTYHITYQSDKALGDSIIKELDKVGKSLNVFDSCSLVSRANRELSTPVDTHFATVYKMAKEVSHMTSGAFDPTLGPLIKAWGFGPGHTATADTLHIDSLLAITGIDRTELRGDTLYKDDVRTNFNFSAIAKGYGCDCVARMLERNGVQNYLVEIGGEIVAAGESPSGKDWSVSVDRPVLGAAPDSRESQAIVGFTGKGMATSGNYRNFHKESGHVYGHTISATTGRPVQTDVISATVLAPSCMEADALATAFMAMGLEKSRSLNDSLKLPVMLILSDTTVWASEEFKAILVPENRGRN